MLRFKKPDGSEYPEWETPALESIGSFYGGLSGKTKDDFGKGTGKFVTYMNVYKNTFASHEMLESVDVGNKEHQNTVSYGDILMSQSSETVEEVGLSSVYLYDDEPYLNSFCFGFSLNDLNMTYPQYMGYLMRSDAVRKQIMREGQGISRINLSPNRIRNIKLSIPCLEEQQKIADCLSSVDAVIADYEAQVDNMQNQKKGVMQKLFSQEVRFKADDGSEYSEWEQKKLKEICDDFIVPMRDKPKVFDGTIPWCRIEDVEGNYIHDSSLGQYVSEETIKKMNLKVHPTGTVICSCSASLGTYMINTQPLVTNQTFIGLVCGKELNNHFLLYYMNTQTRNLKQIASGTTIPYISRQKFEEYSIALPCLEEQQKIANCLTAFDNAIEDLQKTVEHWKNIKKGLLQQLFA